MASLSSLISVPAHFIPLNGSLLAGAAAAAAGAAAAHIEVAVMKSDDEKQRSPK